MTFPRCVGGRAVLLAAVLTSGCLGSSATVSPGTGVQPGAGGRAVSGSGGATTGVAGSPVSGSGDTGMTDTGTGGTDVTGAGDATGLGGAVSTGTGGGPTTGGGGGMSATSSGGTTGTTTGAGAGPAWGTPAGSGPTGTGVAAAVTVVPGTTVGNIGPGFAGFSYEKTHITNDSLNSTNKNLVALYKLIGSPMIRLGADDADNCTWGGVGDAPAQPVAKFPKVIYTGMVDQLCSFLAATGSKIIYAVNFHATPDVAAAEATYVMNKCGSSIYGFEIGNEINRYLQPGGKFDTDPIRTTWEASATEIVKIPGAMLVGPAGGGGDAVSLSTPFANDEAAKFPGRLILLTQHYYAGTANTSTATVARLQTPDYADPTSSVGLVGTESAMNKAATNNHIPGGYRCGECNTFSAHGQMGVSDTLIAGLWGLDLMFVTAENGGSGVNLHGGEAGMDGTRQFYYEPIMELAGVVVQAQPIYYTQLMMTLAGQGPMVMTNVATSNPNFTAYAIKANGFTSVVLDNKNATTGVNATVSMGAPVASASALYLQGTPAGSLQAPATAVTLGGASVTPAGVWNHNPPFILPTSGNTFTAYIPPASAALVRVLQ